MWAGDPTGDYCAKTVPKYEPWKCDGMLCSAPTRDCKCKAEGLEKAGRETHIFQYYFIFQY